MDREAVKLEHDLALMDRRNGENNCENANTHAHGVLHKVVLAHLQSRRC
jgi:hypothetical protein